MFPYLGRGRSPDPSIFPAIWPWEVSAGAAPFNVLYNGDFAVLVFFVLSGFVLMRKFWHTGERMNLVASAIKRYPRLIFPAAASVFVACALMRMGWMHAQDHPDASFAGWVQAHYNFQPSIQAAFHAAFVGVPFIGDGTATAWGSPLWTMRIELWGSLVLFGVYFVFGRWKAAAFVVFLAICFLLPKGLTLNLIPFAIGASLNGAVGWLQRHPRASIAFFAIGMLLGMFDYTPTFRYMAAIVPAGYDQRSFWYVFAASFLVAGLLGSAGLARFFGSKVCAYFGRISFALYLLHWPIVFSFSIWAVGRFMALGADYLHAAWYSYFATFGLLIVLAELFTQDVDIPATRFADWLAKRVTSVRRPAEVPAASPVEV
jgi:peptidoglycan/LPS O-acetylase OafA/YrhL